MMPKAHVLGLVAIGLAATLGGTLMSQTPPPAAPLSVFDQALGRWSGSGTVRLDPAASPVAWNADISFSRILDGHFIQQDGHVMFAGKPTALVSRRVYAHDALGGGFACFHVDNTGLVSLGDSYWTEGNRLVGIRSRVERGRLILEQSTLAFAGSRADLRIQRLGQDGSWFDHVRGSLQRTSGASPAGGEAAAFNPAGSEMASLSGLIGNWGFAGSYRPAPDAGERTTSGSCRIGAILGGHALHSTFAAAGSGGHRAEAIVAWDGSEGCYQRISLTNDGRATRERGYLFTNGDIAFMSAGGIGTQPQTRRTIVRFEDGGNRVVSETDRCLGSWGPDRAMTITYDRIPAQNGGSR